MESSGEPQGTTAVAGEATSQYRFFATYSGMSLPLRLVGPLRGEALSNRNTYMRAAFDTQGRLLLCEKLVYGEVEMTHRYEYHASGALKLAEITMLDEAPATLSFREGSGGEGQAQARSGE